MLVLNMYNIGCHPLLAFKVSILHQKYGLPTNAMLYVVVFVVVVVVVVFVVAVVVVIVATVVVFR